MCRETELPLLGIKKKIWWANDELLCEGSLIFVGLLVEDAGLKLSVLYNALNFLVSKDCSILWARSG